MNQALERARLREARKRVQRADALKQREAAIDRTRTIKGRTERPIAFRREIELTGGCRSRYRSVDPDRSATEHRQVDPYLVYGHGTEAPVYPVNFRKPARFYTGKDRQNFVGRV